MEKLISLGGKLKRVAGVAMLLTLALFIFAGHAHHLCDRYGNPDSACTQGAAHSHAHWPEAGDDYANPAVTDATTVAPEKETFSIQPAPSAPESHTLEAPQHIPIHA